MDAIALGRVEAIMNSPSVTVTPAGDVDNVARGILQATRWENLKVAVTRAFAAVVVTAALAAGGGVQEAHAGGVGYDANVYGQAQGQVMQQGNATRMEVVNVRPVKIEVAPQQSSGGEQVAGYAMTGAGAAVGGIIGGQFGKTNAARQVGSIVGSLLGAVGGNYAAGAMRGGSGPQVIDGVELTMVNPANGQYAVITQAGTQGFNPGDRVLVVQTGNASRVVLDRGRSQSQSYDQLPPGYERAPVQPMSYGVQPRDDGARLMNGAELERSVGAVSRRAAQLGIQVDANAVANLLATGAEKDGLSIGKVVAVERGLVYQSTGRGMGVVHAVNALDTIPRVGEVAAIVMRGGEGRVSGGQGQDRGMGRF